MVINIFRLLKKITFKLIVNSLFIYSFNCIGMKFNVFIPINLINILFISIFGTLGVIFIVLFKLFI